MPKANIFSQSQAAFVRELYMRQMRQPADITDALNAKYGTTYLVEQIRRMINSRGWSARRKAVVEKLGPIEKKKDSQIVREIATAHARVMDDVAKKSQSGMMKALDFVERAGDARSLNAAASAVKSLMGTFRLAAGIDNSTTAKSTGGAYHFNFINAPLRSAQRVEAAPAESIEAPSECSVDVEMPRSVNVDTACSVNVDTFNEEDGDDSDVDVDDSDK